MNLKTFSYLSVFLSLFLAQSARANTLTFSVRSYPCLNGRSLGLYISNMTGVETVTGYCNFDTLRGYINDPYGSRGPAVGEKNRVIAEKCLDEDEEPWMKVCYDSFAAKCLETKEIRYGYSSAVKTYIKSSCKDGRTPQPIPQQRGRPTPASS